ncbi:MAG: sporulation integral membrane protein YtvI [Clostridiaceae bacterium]
MIKTEDYKNKLDKLIIFFIVYSLVFIVFFKTLKYTLPFVLAIIFSLILYRPTMYIIRKFNIKNTIASLIVTLIFYTIILALLVWLTVIIAQELISLGKNIQTYITLNQTSIYDFFNKIQNYFMNMDESILNSIRDNIVSSLSNLSKSTVQITTGIVKLLLSTVSFIPYIFLVIIFSILSTYFFMNELTDKDSKNSELRNSENFDKFKNIVNESKRMLSRYLASYALIISVTFVETLIGFSIIHIKYTVILSFIAAFFDILPILGIGTMYIPLAIIYFITGNIFKSIFIICMYLIVTIVRNIIEPKIVSSTLGIPPIQVLIALFVGLEAYGISGMFFCIFLVVFYNILKQQNIL